ncbi:hypothetical protein PUR34_01480, partial [Streptomyces sp. JV185]|nr:hypothetical protein [Streptomyces sp. JV185]
MPEDLLGRLDVVKRGPAEAAVLLLGPGGDVLLTPRAPSGDPADGRTDEQLRLSLLPGSDGDPVVA